VRSYQLAPRIMREMCLFLFFSLYAFDTFILDRWSSTSIRRVYHLDTTNKQRVQGRSKGTGYTRTLGVDNKRKKKDKLSYFV
jgi:hypothetical protein